MVKNFEEDNSNKNARGWRGIGLKSVGDPPPDPKVLEPKKSCKQEGGENESRYFVEENGNFSSEPPTQGNFSENAEKVSVDEKVSEDGFTTPLRWTEDGVTWEYIPAKESE